MPAAMVEQHLPEVEVLIGQTDMPAERLERAAKLRAIINIEGNFLPNIDYATCFRRGIWVLNASPVFAQTVAEMALGMMLDLARGISAADRAFREGREVYGLESNAESFLIRGQPVGLIGFGDLGRAFRRLLVPFACPVKVYDPWLPDLLIRDHDCLPAGARRGAGDLARDRRVRGRDRRTTGRCWGASSSSGSGRAACSC